VTGSTNDFVNGTSNSLNSSGTGTASSGSSLPAAQSPMH
jgi:hypothetical protein